MMHIMEVKHIIKLGGVSEKTRGSEFGSSEGWLKCKYNHKIG